MFYRRFEKRSYVRKKPDPTDRDTFNWEYWYKGKKIKSLKEETGREGGVPDPVKRKENGKNWYYSPGKKKSQTLADDGLVSEFFEIRRCKIVQLNVVKVSQIVTPVSKSGSGARLKYTRYTNNAWELEIISGGKNYINGEKLTINVGGQQVSFKIFTDSGKLLELNPFDMLADYPKYDGETKSNDSNPEHSISYVNEIRKPDGRAPKYPDLSVLGLWISSSVDIQNISQVSTYITKGIEGRAWTGGSSYRSINTLPEIVFDLLSNEEYGLGGIVGRRGVDEGQMSRTAQYCRNMGFYWTGVIKDRINIRQWIFEQAGYILSDFCIQGGKFFLKPSFPLHSDKRIHSNERMHKTDTRPVTIKALFTDGNTRNARTSFLTPDERQMFKAEVLYREEETNGFAKIVSKTIRLSSKPAIGQVAGRKDDPLERFDMSAFCTSEDHATLFARFALRNRQLITHSVQFESTPESCRNLAPGDYVRYISTVTHFDRFSTGSIAASGAVQCHRDPRHLNNKRIMFWNVGSGSGIREGTLKVDENGLCTDTQMQSSVFVVKDRETNNRIYKIESIQYTDEGLVELAATEAPVDDTLRLLVLDWRDDDFIEYG